MKMLANKKLLLILGTIVALIIVFLFIPGEVEIRVEQPGGYLLQGEQKITTPITLKGPYGTKEFPIGAEGYLTELIPIKFTPLTKKTLTVSLTTKNEDISEFESHQTGEDWMYIFPHNDTNFSVDAQFGTNNSGKQTVKQITITPHLPISPSGGFDEQEVERAKNDYVNEAKTWLKENGVPDSIKIVIDSPI